MSSEIEKLIAKHGGTEKKDLEKLAVELGAKLDLPKMIRKHKGQRVYVDEEKLIQETLKRIPKQEPIKEKITERVVVQMQPVLKPIEFKNTEAEKRIKKTEEAIKGINRNLSFRSHAQSTSGGEVDKLSQLVGDVKITNVANAQILTYNSTSGKWENSVGGFLTKSQADTYYYPLSSNPAGYLTASTNLWTRTLTTLSPATAGDSLDMGTGSITADGGFLSSGGVTSLTVPAGDGYRFMWLPTLGAFRAGYSDFSDTIGELSATLNAGKASGYGATAVGAASANAPWAFASGDVGTVVSGEASAGFGSVVVVPGAYSFAAGDTITLGSNQLIFGFGNNFTNNTPSSFAVGFDAIDLLITSGLADFQDTNITTTGTLGAGAITGTTLTHTGMKEKYRLITSADSLVAIDDFVAVTGTTTVTLPTSVGVSGQIYTIKNIGTAIVTIATTSSQTIDGVTTYVIRTTNSGVQIISDNANWLVKGVF